jgi:hypothetical protein
VIHEAPAVLLCCLALLPQEVLDIQNNLYQVGGEGRLCSDACVCPGSHPQEPCQGPQAHSGNHLPNTGPEAEDTEMSIIYE